MANIKRNRQISNIILTIIILAARLFRLKQPL